MAVLSAHMNTKSESGEEISTQLRDAAADARQIADTNLTQSYLNRLGKILEERGVRITINPPALIASNSALPSDPQGARLFRGLSQKIEIRHIDQCGLSWCWVWPGLRPPGHGVPTPPPEIERICPADDIHCAADRIVNVVRLHSEGSIR